MDQWKSETQESRNHSMQGCNAGTHCKKACHKIYKKLRHILGFRKINLLIVLPDRQPV